MVARHFSDPDSVGNRVSAGFIRALPPSDAPTFQRSLKGFSFHRRKTFSSVPEDTWGSLGLRLLYSPPEPLIDFIFVHGLRGGSVKTWQKTNDPRLYWPEFWLPREPDLQNARIHTFGYNSDWGEMKDTTSLDLHDFGRSLLSDMITSPELRKHSQTPIILIGHSMGGLVMKKAYLLARQDDRTQDLADRIQCMFFLATPHRGSESAKLLNNILRASAVLSSKQYISDISKDSPVLTTINDEFKYCLDKLQLWSFYETIKTKMRINAIMVVERDSATIGHMNENRIPLNADHRNVCKFESPADPNYVTIRNSLVKATEDILGDVFKQKAEEMKTQIGVLESYMHIAHSPEDDLVTMESERTQGSCEWVTKLESFESWRHTRDDGLLCYWLTGQAGAGKSVLATYIVRHLQGLGVDTCYYFFRHGQKAQQTVSSFLRALAFQMALLHPSVRQVLSSMRDSAVIFDRDDERAIWRKIFVNGILPISIPTTQYWVIDGLDECVDSEKLFPFLQKFESDFSIRILISSRRLPELEKHFSRFEPHLFRYHIDLDDTRSDIQRFAENNSDSLPVEPRNRPALIEKLVQKSDGAFLWIVLAFEALGDVFSEEEVDEVLGQVPMGMAPLYNRILGTMARNPRHTRLIQQILKWTVCSTRPLTILELQAALRLDLGSKILNVGKVVEELCGQLLRVDKNKNVHLVHATARDFLLSEDSDPVFSMDEAETNKHLATVCLQYLIEDEMRPPRHPALISRKVQRSPLLDYSCTSFSEHLASSSPASDELFWLLDKFFRTNVLSWVEYILSQKKNLYFLPRASKNLRQYLDRRAKYVSPLNDRHSSIVKWQMDLLRIALKFGDNLLQDPASIYFLVPPLCPSETSIHKQFGSPNKGLRLSGLTNKTWDDCICYIDYRQSRALSLAGCDDVFAMGMKSGDIKLFKQTTYQEFASLRHGEPVKLLRFDTASQHLASAGFRQLKMWSIDGTLLWSVPHGGYLAAMAFTEDNDRLVTLNKHSILITWNAEDGTKFVDGDQDEGHESNPNLRSGKFQVVFSADVCPNTELLAIAYRGRPPQIWSIEHDVMLSTCNRACDRPGFPIMPVAQVLFNPSAEVELLAVSYQDGGLAIFDRWAEGDNEIKSVTSVALTLAATSDGRTLATGDAMGTINLWDFETLTLLYSIKSSEYDVRSLAFSGDCFRLYDIRDTKTKIWEPSVLVRKTVSEESSISEPVTAPAPVTGRDDLVVDIACILAPPGTGTVFVGRDDGTVSSYDTASGEVAATMYSHRRGGFVTGISWNGSAIASADAFGTVDVYAVQRLGGGARAAAGWAVGEKVLQVKFVGLTRGLLLHPAAPWLLVFQLRSSTLVSVQTRAQYPLPVDEADHYRAWIWLSPQAGSVCLVGARGREMDVFYDLEQQQAGQQGGVSKPGAVWKLTMKDGSPVPLDIAHLTSDKSGRYLAVQLDTATSDGEEPKLLVYGTAHLADKAGSRGGGEEQDTPTAREEQPALTIASRHIKSFLGFYGDRVAFLDHQLWVRSVDLSKTASAGAAAAGAAAVLDTLAERHFYIPRELVGASNGVGAVVTDAGTVVFPKDGELGVVKNAFEWSFKRPVADTTTTTGDPRGAAFGRRGGRGRGTS